MEDSATEQELMDKIRDLEKQLHAEKSMNHILSTCLKWNQIYVYVMAVQVILVSITYWFRLRG